MTTTTGRGAATRERILDAATASFGGRGYEATSLDALADELELTKQSILYHFPSKAVLLDAAVARSARELVEALEATLLGAGGGFDRVEAIVRTVFRMALRRPELLGLLREVHRHGGEPADRLAQSLEPLVERATAFLEAEMEAGTFRRSEPRLLLVSCYSTVVGVATEVEVLRTVGIEPTLRATAVRRRELLDFLRSALVAPTV